MVWDGEAGEWRRRHNHKLIAFLGLLPISNVIRSQRLQYDGHNARMEEKRLTRRVMLGKPIGTRPRGRPRKRWMDNLTEDLGILEIDPNEWMKLAEDRALWRRTVKAAMDPPGPSPPE
ncbi:uncharacterized protein [Palaemon carinicauda]|uniref:uncharacterized protein n=1 Tax=Palaemon carinicauda TaxID=392227 RepID=UPI0035B644AB